MKTKSLSAKSAARLLPTRGKFDNKTSGGKSLIIAGSPGMRGAAFLTAEACSRVGSGYTTIMTELTKYNPAKHPDFLTIDVKSWRKTNWINYSAIAMGPGLRGTERDSKIIQSLIEKKIGSVVLDAGALTALKKIRIKGLPSEWIITPHSGELARLLDTTSKSVEKNRIDAALKAYEKFGCVIVLKGAETLIFDGKVMLKNLTGHPALAKAGTGDVLTGIITGFRAQGLSPLSAAALGAHVHGLCARRWVAEGRDQLSLMAGDLNNLLPYVITNLRKGVTKN